MIRANAPSPLMVQSAAARVYAAWLPRIGEIEAREQAEAFARRFHILLDGPLWPQPPAANLVRRRVPATASGNPADAPARSL